MAEEAENQPPAAAGGGDEGGMPEEVKCPECPPGLPGWMATFSDLVTLLLTFFVLLLSFAKTETAKYEAALGSIRDAFGGNVLKQGEVIQRGKSPDNFPTMMESQTPIKPFPIEFLTMEGILDKHEINRESDEDLKKMRFDLGEYGLSDNVDVYEQPEGVKVNIQDKIYFEEGSTKIATGGISSEILTKVTRISKEGDWIVMVIGHASRGEVGSGGQDAFELSSLRAMEVTRFLIKSGVSPAKITTAFYGDTKPESIPGVSQDRVDKANRRVEFVLRKNDLKYNGHKVESR